MPAVLWLRFFKETRDDFLNVFCRYLHFFIIFLFLFIKYLLEAWTDICNLSLFISDTDQWSFSHLVFSDIRYEE